jgi:CO/xanthine dehydrogenase FAD-binding subunit
VFYFRFVSQFLSPVARSSFCIALAHVAIRNRGTLGGSLSLADPAAELPACMVALNATLVVAGRTGERRVGREDRIDHPLLLGGLPRLFAERFERAVEKYRRSLQKIAAMSPKEKADVLLTDAHVGGHLEVARALLTYLRAYLEGDDR